MADSTINGLSSGTTPLAGTEEVPIWQSSSTKKVTVQDIADLASGSNIGNSDLTISASGARKLILGGALSTDYFTIRNSADTTDVLKVQGDDSIIANFFSIGTTKSTSYPFRVNASTTASAYIQNSSASGVGVRIDTTGTNSRGLYVVNTGTNTPDGIEVSLTGNAAIKTGIDLNISGTATNNIGLDLNVSGGSNNYAIDFVAGDLKFSTGTGSKIGTATSQKIGFWNATPVVQPTTGITAGTFTANTSGISDDSATFDGYTIGQIAAALRQVGILA